LLKNRSYYWMENIVENAGFEVLTAVIITPCSALKVHRFGGTYRLHLRGRKISRARNQRESRWQICYS
jgi:hypothetical protein